MKLPGQASVAITLLYADHLKLAELRKLMPPIWMVVDLEVTRPVVGLNILQGTEPLVFWAFFNPWKKPPCTLDTPTFWGALFRPGTTPSGEASPAIGFAVFIYRFIPTLFLTRKEART